MNLENLKKEIPFKWRVQIVNKWGAQCVAYIDARDVQDLLDEVVGASHWQCKYEEHKGNLFCSIGIDNGAEYIWKSDCGTESNVEKQKGEASDAFKRAAVMWGIGRFLYSKPIVKIKEVQKNNQGKFEPIENGKKIWDITEYCNRMQRVKPKLGQKSVKFCIEKNYTLEQIKELYVVDAEQEVKLKAMLNGSK